MRPRCLPRWGWGIGWTTSPPSSPAASSSARAMAKNPKLLLCDEPTGALDYHTGKAILRLLQDTCYDTGKTVVLITHNSAFTAIADRVIHIREGRVAGVEINEAPLSADVLEW